MLCFVLTRNSPPSFHLVTILVAQASELAYRINKEGAEIARAAADEVTAAYVQQRPGRLRWLPAPGRCSTLTWGPPGLLRWSCKNLDAVDGIPGEAAVTDGACRP